MEPNRDAAAKMEEYLEMQHRRNLPTSMADVQSRYQAMPYGWREIDIAAVAARLISEQKVTIKYAGNTIQPNNPKLPDMLRKKSEIGRTSISKRQVVSITKMKEVKEFLREYFDVMDVPDDEDGLIAFIIQKFSEQSEHYKELYKRYFVPNRKYPDQDKVSRAMQLMADVLSQQKDNIALIDRVIQKQDDLFDNKERLARVENFFKSQVTVFDAAARMEGDLRIELDYLSHEPEANDALNHIRMMVVVPNGFDYKKIPMLNGWMATVREVCVTTNGILLPELARSLKEAGVRRLNLSLDTLHPGKYAYITRTGDIHTFWEGFHAAMDAGFEKIKINAVLMGGFNDDEIEALAGLTRQYPVDMRFIEMMPMYDGGDFTASAYIPYTRVLEKLPDAVPVQQDGGVAKRCC